MNEQDRKIILANARLIYGKTGMGRRQKNARQQRPKWPIPSLGLGGAVKDRDKLAEHLKKSGVPTEITSDGDPVCTSQHHQNKVAQALGFANKDRYN